MQWLYYSIKTWLTRSWVLVLLTTVAGTFFIAVSSYNYLSQSPDFVKWSSPDETANYFLTRLYSQSVQLTYLEKYNLVSEGIIMPRSFRSDGALVKPVSFLGLILIYGPIAKLLGVAVIPYLTPAFAALGLIIFYLIVKRLFDRHSAIIATCLLSAFPVYVYYSARSMFHNLLFIVLWLAGLYLALKMTDQARPLNQERSWSAKYSYYWPWALAGLAGLVTGLAATVRSSEMIWLIPMLGIVWLFNFKRSGLVKPLLFIYFFGLAFLPISYWNTVLYDAPTKTGYPQMDKSISNIVTNSTGVVRASADRDVNQVKSFYQQAKQSFFVFGFKPEHSRKMFYYYVYRMFTWLVYGAVLGLIFLVFKLSHRKRDLCFVTSYGLLSLILIYYYGSWIFYDNPDPNSYTIGNSYTRYWLPVYLGALALCGYGIARLTAWLKWPPLILLGRSIVVGSIMFSSIIFVLYGSAEGLAPSLDRQIASRTEYDQLICATEANAVIVTRYHDKLLFPQRRVIVGNLSDPKMNLLYAGLAKRLPIYYYNFSYSDADLVYLNNTSLKTAGLSIVKVAPITNKFTLYRLNKLEFSSDEGMLIKKTNSQ